MAATTGATQGITPFLWFNGRVEEALNFYTSIFEDSKIDSMHRMPGSDPSQPGKVFTATFHLNGVEFMVMDGGAHFAMTPGTSFFVKVETQEEVDHYWEKLSEGGHKDRCGWLTDQFGVTWQIIPNALGRLMYTNDPAKSKRVMDAMMKMTKIIIADLENA